MKRVYFAFLLVDVLALVACSDRTRSLADLNGINGDSNDSSEGNGASDPRLPRLTIASPPASLLGGSDHTITFSITAGTAPVTNARIELAMDGTSFSLLSVVEETTTRLVWLVPTVNAPIVRLRLVAGGDGVNDEAVALSDAFNIDSSVPTGFAFTRTSPTPTNSPFVQLRIDGCGDATQIAFNVPSGTSLVQGTNPVSCTAGTQLVFEITGGDGSYTFIATGRDAAGNSSQTAPNTMVFDTTPPAAPTLVLDSANPSDSLLVLASPSSCETETMITFAEQAPVPCSAAMGSLMLTLAADGFYEDLGATATDLAGNVSAPSAPLSVLADTIDPSASLSAPPAVASGLSAQIRWLASDANFTNVAIDYYDTAWHTLATLTAPSGMYTWNPVPIFTGSGRVRVRAHDIVGHETIVESSPFIFDSLAPTVPSGSLSFASVSDPNTDNPAIVSTPFALFDFQASDVMGEVVSEFCFKRVYGSATPPPITYPNECWHRFDDKPIPDIPAPSNAITVTDFPFNLGFVPGDLRVFLWVRDLAGRISDPAFIRTIYDPGQPPVITNFFATTNNAPCSPIAPSDVVVRENEALFIKWNVEFPPSYPYGPTGAPESTIPVGAAIDIDYTTNDRDYVDIPGAQALLNASNAGCALTNQGTNTACPGGPNDPTVKTGCFEWPAGAAKPSGYFRIRLRATNNKGIQSVRSTVPPLNTYDQGASGATGDDSLTRRIDFLAGNPDPGLGGNARSTVLNNQVYRADASFDLGSFAVSSRGVIYFRDRDNGLLWINPVNGNVERLIRLEPTTVGQGDGQDLFDVDGKPNLAITLQQPQFITVDFDDNLLVLDYNRVRRIEADPATGLPLRIEALFGGGTVDAGQDLDPASIEISGQCAGCFISVVPNGDVIVPSWLYLRVDGGGTLWHYKANRPLGPPTVSNINYSGHGYFVQHYDYDDPADCTAPSASCPDVNQALCDTRADSDNHRKCLGCVDDGTSNSTEPWPSCPNGTRCNTNPASANYNVCEWEISNCTMQEPLIELDNTGNISRMHAWLTGTYIGSPCPFGRVTTDAQGVSISESTPAARHQSIPGAYQGGAFFRAGLDGKSYYFDTFQLGALYRYDHGAVGTTGEFTRILGLGNGTSDQNCPDGTEATSCVVEIQDVFVDALSNVYFMAHGKLRVIVDFYENSEIKRVVRTVAGQGFFFGDGGDALSARFTFISSLKRWNNASTQKIVLTDVVNLRLREADVGGNVRTIAGTGLPYYDPALPPPEQTLFNRVASTRPYTPNTGTRLAVGPSGQVYSAGDGARPSVLDRTDGMWKNMGSPTASTLYTAADGSDQGVFGSANVFGLTATHVLWINMLIDASLYPSTGGWGDGMVKQYALADGVQTHFTGVPGAMVGAMCNDGGGSTPRETCGMPMTYYWINTEPTFDDFGTTADCTDDRWVLPVDHSILDRRVFTIPADCDQLPQPQGSNEPPQLLLNNDGVVVIPEDPYTSLVYVRRPDLGAEVLYSCSTVDGRLKRYQISPAPVGPRETTLFWPAAAMSCVGSSLLWDDTRKSLTFAYEQGGFYGIAEYLDVP